MSIFQMISPSVSSTIKPLSSLTFISNNTPNFSNLSLYTPNSPPLRTSIIRMGGGPRTFPGGVSKWQWKRMQAKKSKQLLKARLARERQIYEMRKRAELKAALSELERPWEVVEKAPTLFSVKADEQLKVLADRFQKPGGFDMWSEEDGPELFKNGDGFESARFFPKGVVHSVKPYGKVGEIGSVGEGVVDDNRDRRGDDGLISWKSVLGGGGDDGNVRAKTEKRSDKMVGDGSGGSNERRMRDNVYKKKRDRRSRNSGGSEERSSRGVAGDERRNVGQVYDKRDYRMQNSRDSTGSEENSLREVAVGENNGRRNLAPVYKKRDYRLQNSRDSTGSEENSLREVAVDEGNGRRNLAPVYKKRDYRLQNSRDSTGSEGNSLREVAVDEGNGRRNLPPVYKKRDYRVQNSSHGRKESSKGEVYDLRLERDGSYEFLPEN